MTDISIIREPDDPLADVRISLESPRAFDGLYLVFRGDPTKVVALLRTALAIAEVDLPAEKYKDNRKMLS